MTKRSTIPDGEWTLSIEIDANGNLKARVHGLNGPGCEDVMGLIDDLGEVTEHRKTPEYYQRNVRGAGRSSQRKQRTGR